MTHRIYRPDDLVADENSEQSTKNTAPQKAMQRRFEEEHQINGQDDSDNHPTPIRLVKELDRGALPGYPGGNHSFSFDNTGEGP